MQPLVNKDIKNITTINYLRALIISALLISFLITFSTPVYAAEKKSAVAGKVILTFEKPTGDIDHELAGFITDDQSLRESIDIINQMAKLKKNIHIIFRNDPKNKSPFYDRKKDTIYFSYGFMTEHHKLLMKSLEKFSKENPKYAYSEDEMLETADNEVIDFTHYVLFHELGHAIIDVNKLPVVGSEEVAADNLATILILDTFDKNTAIKIIQASKLAVKILQSKSLSLAASASQHAASGNRVMDMLCLATGRYPSFASKLGHKPDKVYTEYVKKRTNPKKCKPFYKHQNTMWLQLLSGKIEKSNAPTNGKILLHIKTPSNKNAEVFYQRLKNDKNLPAILQKAAAISKLPVNITVLFTDKIKRDDAFFDKKQNTIVYPYQALIFTSKLYDRPSNDPKKQKEISDSLSYKTAYYTIMLNLANAIIDLKRLPITGGKALAAQQLATVLTVNLAPNGLVNVFISRDVMERRFHYQNKHSPMKNKIEHNAISMLMYNRLTGVTCLAFGKNPKAAAPILKRMISDEMLSYYAKKTKYCVGEYKYLSKLWLKLLSEY